MDLLRVRFFLIFAFCSWPALAQSNQESESNMSCVERLRIPVYPPLARQVEVQGSDTLYSPEPSTVRFVHPGFE
jgi:hypothetical protein